MRASPARTGRCLPLAPAARRRWLVPALTTHTCLGRRCRPTAHTLSGGGCRRGVAGRAAVAAGTAGAGPCRPRAALGVVAAIGSVIGADCCRWPPMPPVPPLPAGPRGAQGGAGTADAGVAARTAVPP